MKRPGCGMGVSKLILTSDQEIGNRSNRRRRPYFKKSCKSGPVPEKNASAWQTRGVVLDCARVGTSITTISCRGVISDFGRVLPCKL